MEGSVIFRAWLSVLINESQRTSQLDIIRGKHQETVVITNPYFHQEVQGVPVPAFRILMAPQLLKSCVQWDLIGC